MLTLTNVRYKYVTRYMTVEALRGVEYEFEAGRLYALRGPSGCGKTTLVSLIAGLDLPTEGEIRFEGRPTGKMNLARHRRENVAVIYQSYNLLPQMTVAENVMYPMELNGIKPKAAREKALELIGGVGLTESEFRRLPHMLSGGQQQRVAIARALGTRVKMILADEPTGNLDSANTSNVITLLKELANSRGYCVIVATHDESVARVADTQLLMEDGRLK